MPSGSDRLRRRLSKSCTVGSESQEATVICKGFTNLLNWIWESVCTSCSIPSGQSVMKWTHTCINNKTTILRYSDACRTNSVSDWIKLTTSENLTLLFSALSFSAHQSVLSLSCCQPVWEQSWTTDEMVSSVSELSWCQVSERERENCLVPITFNHGKLAKHENSSWWQRVARWVKVVRQPSDFTEYHSMSGRVVKMI